MASTALLSAAWSALLLLTAFAQSQPALPTTETGACLWSGVVCGSLPCAANKALPIIECIFGQKFDGSCPEGCEKKEFATTLRYSTSACALPGYGAEPVDAATIDDIQTHCADVDVTDFDVSEESDCFAAVLEMYRQLGCDTDECQDALYANQVRTNKCLAIDDQDTCEQTVASCDDLHTYPEVPEGLEGGVGEAPDSADPATDYEDTAMPPVDTSTSDGLGSYGS